MRVPILAGAATIAVAAFALPVVATTQTGPLIVSVTVSPNPYAIEGTTSVSKSAGILGYGTAANDVALEGYATQAGGVGLEGFSNAASGTAGNGVFGYANNGSGIYGVANNGSYAGVTGYDNLSGGTGVFGSGASYGVSGTSPNVGIIGRTTTSSTDSDSIAAIEGYDDSSSTDQIGVYGQSGGGVGVQAYTSGGPAGVLATSAGDGTSGYAVLGNDVATTTVATSTTDPVAKFAGVSGTSGNNFGVYGEVDAAAGNYTLAGVYGLDNGDGNVGVWGYSEAGIGVLATSGSTAETSLEVQQLSSTGSLIRAFTQGTERMQLDAGGNLILGGTLTQSGAPASTVRDANGVEHITFGAQETAETVEDSGSGEMVRGVAYVMLDPAFASVLDPRAGYVVTVTPEGPNTGVYVTAKTAAGFEVRETSGAGTMAFDYRISGHPRSTRPVARLAVFTGLHDRLRAGPAAAPPHPRTARPGARALSERRFGRGPLLPPMPVVVRPPG